MTDTLKPRKQQALDTRRKINDAAFALFEKEGYDNVSIKDICRKLNVSRGAFYHHFKSKSDIVFSHFIAIEEEYQNFYSSISDLKPDKQLLALFDWYHKQFVDEKLKEAQIIMKVEFGDHNENFVTLNTVQINSVVEIISNGVREGIFKNDVNPEKIADFMFTYFYGIHLTWCMTDGSFKYRDKMDDFYNTYLKKILF